MPSKFDLFDNFIPLVIQEVDHPHLWYCVDFNKLCATVRMMGRWKRVFARINAKQADLREKGQ